MAGNPNFDAVIATTIQKYLPKLADNIFKNRALLDWMNRKNRITFSGGSQIVVPLIYALNSTFKTYSGYDTLDLTPQEGISAAQYDWKQAAISIAIAGIEEAKNNGKEAVLNLLEAKTMQAEETASEKFNDMFFNSDGTGNAGKDFYGLAALVGDATHGPASVGGISGVTEVFWRAKVDDPGSDTALTLADLSHEYNLCSVGNNQPDFEITTSLLWEKYEALLQPQQRFSDEKTAAAGFSNLLHKRAPVVWDEYAPAKTWFFLNSKNLMLVGHKDKWFTMRKFVEPEDKDAKFALILSYGNLVTNNRRMLGKLMRRIP
jgi:hypothetical protein